MIQRKRQTNILNVSPSAAACTQAALTVTVVAEAVYHASCVLSSL